MCEKFSFILIPHLTSEQETKEFLTVNNTQKGVPKSLTVYLEGTEAAQVAWGLNEEADSPFNGRITKNDITTHTTFLGLTA